MTSIAEKELNSIFNICPQNIGGFEFSDFNGYVDLENHEVLLELVEYEVVLPITGYTKGEVVFVLQFEKTEFQIKKVEVTSSNEIKEDVLHRFTITQVKSAISKLIEVVTSQLGE